MTRTLIIILFISFYTQLFAQEIAITFDDAPTSDGPVFSGEERTNKILTQLKTYSVDQVAFFVITGNIDARDKKRLQRYTDAGHLLANHTHSHQWIHNIGVTDIVAIFEKLIPYFAR